MWSQTEASIAELRRRANAGDAVAQVELGRAYEDGMGVEQSDTKAVELFRKAAEQGNAQAQNSLGVMYALGRGVERNREEAVRWYRKAAKNGLSEGFYNVAISYFNGEGVNEDLALAYAYMTIAESRGNPQASQALQHIRDELHDRVEHAKFRLAVIYEKGDEVPQDYPRALKLYRELAATGLKFGFAHQQAEFKICEFYALGRGVPQDYTEAKFHCKRVAGEGHRLAKVTLGRMAAKGLGSEVNLKEAEEWFRSAAAAGDLQGVLELGNLKLQIGSHDAVQEAYFWFYVAGMQGIKEADAPLQKAAAQLSTKEQDSVAKAYQRWLRLPEEGKKKKIKFR
ncbi:MAG TPA: tetratricopeptide repeat protein [Candidatus Angelobacter sp.]